MLMPPISVMDIPPVMLAVRHFMSNRAPGRVSRISSNTEHATISVCSFAAYLFTQRAKLTNLSPTSYQPPYDRWLWQSSD